MNTTKPDRYRNPGGLTAEAREKGDRVKRIKALAAYEGIAPRIINMRESDMSLGEIANALNAEGHRTRKGSLFRRHTILRIIERASHPAETIAT